MSVRCSVLGHELATEEREVSAGDNDEVTIVQSVEVCERCDYEQTIRENKQVSIAEAEAEFHDDLGPHATQPDELVDADQQTQSAITDGGDPTPIEEPDDGDHDVPGDDAMIIDADSDSDSEPEPEPTPESTTRQESSQASPTPSPDPQPTSSTPTPDAEEDAMLLDNEPDAEHDPFDDLEPDWAQEDDDEPLDDSTVLNPDGTTEGGQDDGTFSPGAFNGEIPDDEPEETASHTDGEILSASDDAITTSTPSGTSNTSLQPSTSNTPKRAVNADLVCDTCRFGVKKEGTPIRVGDICPECRRGYIESAE